MRHIHADHMIAAANDTSIKWEQLSSAGIWIGDNALYWWPERHYRQRPTPHPHQAMIDQAAANPSIKWQYLQRGSDCDWSDCPHLSGPQWHIEFNYRQKPAEPKMVDLWQWARKERGIILASTSYFVDADEAQAAFHGIVLCRIEGSKITVEVSQ